MPAAYDTLLEQIKDIGRLEMIEALLDWDQQTNMPSKGTAARAEMIAMTAALKHERKSSSTLAQALGQLSDDDPDSVRATNIRETRRMHQRATKVPTDLVKQIAHTSSLAHETWADARDRSDFSIFAPLLDKMLDLKRKVADCIGYEDEPYDALMDEFEPGARTADVARVFADLRSCLVPLVQAITRAPKQPDPSILSRHYPRLGQETLARKLSEEMGFDFEAGRMDVSVHPFCTSMGSQDVRITTRYDENFLSGAIFGVMHETGHALYEQGLLAEHVFTPRGSSVSLGIHESQSRLWENMVGRSRVFWERRLGLAKECFPEALSGVDLDAFYGAINHVSPSPIRVEADEVTYNLHIIVRFEIERELLNGTLRTADLPDAWNQRMEDVVGIRPENDAKGCLQDIHWSMGAFGYFPTYALGNLYAAQFFAKAKEEIGDLDAKILDGDLLTLREWLRSKIHSQGMRYTAPQLVEEVTGKPLSIDPFMEYITAKQKPLHGLA